jgi:hypothetical protein
MGEFALPCIVCEKPLKNVAGAADNQPAGGTEFTTMGHYGSTIIDELGSDESGSCPMEFVVNICDTCILRALDADVIQSRSKDRRPEYRYIALSHHPVDAKARAWVLAQNEKYYGSAYGKDEPVDYREKMLEAGWPEKMLDDE